MKKLIIISLIAVFLFAGCNWFQAPAENPVAEDPIVEDVPEEIAADSESKEVTLAKCLTEKGVKFYAAEWCGHCKKQKAAFKDGLEYLDFQECAEGEEWAQECKDADITAVPTWIFADGERKSGNTPLTTLAELAECEY